MRSIVRLRRPENDVFSLFNELDQLLVPRFSEDLKAHLWREKDDHFLLSIDLPGVNPKDLDLEFKNDALLVNAKREDHFGHKSHFQKAFSLPDHVNVDNIQAKFEHGVLSLAVEKSKRAKGRKIELSHSTENSFWGKLLGRKNETTSEE